MRKKMIGILVLTLLIATTYSVAGRICEPAVPEEKNYNIESDQSPGEEPIPQASAIVYTNKFIYHKYEPVDITFKNNGPGTVSLGGPPIFQINRFSFRGWEYVFPDWMHLMLFDVQAGGYLMETWNQKTTYGNQVPWGIYKVDVPYYDYFSNSPQNATDIFVILP
jgi:hypothetical protein